jgi:hypothetical protein
MRLSTFLYLFLLSFICFSSISQGILSLQTIPKSFLAHPLKKTLNPLWKKPNNYTTYNAVKATETALEVGAWIV